ncbi:TspO protein [Candidatus Parcubacteria bacterium]|nr:MAG: TspO protein [Candidatus Parcubacteria bacterium]
MKKKNRLQKFLAAIIISMSAGVLGSLFTQTGPDSWYVSLIKPEFNPPNWIFGPVWTSLYILMGISLYLIWDKGLKKKELRFAFGIFILQLLFNAWWSILFFGLQNPKLAFCEIVFLWFLIVFVIYLFSNIRKLAAWLLIPYLLWVSFATVLNYSIWVLN